MRLIDLMVKIANNEKTPELIKVGGEIYKKYVDWNTKEVIDYLCGEESLFDLTGRYIYCFINQKLNYDIEILED